MRPFKLETLDTAPAQTRETLQKFQEKLGFVPNIAAVIAPATSTLEGYQAFAQAFDGTSLSDTEKEVVEIVTSVENGCGYCVAGHSAFAAAKNIPDRIVRALRANASLDDQRLEALATFTRTLVHNRGKTSQADLIQLFDAGFSPVQVLEIIQGVSLKTFTNLIANCVQLPLDSAFEPFRWHERLPKAGSQ